MLMLSRRTKFLFLTLFYLVGCLLFEFITFDKYLYLFGLVCLIFIFNLIALYPGYTLKDIFYISFQPVILTLATILGLINFPNLNEYFRIILIIISGFLLYISTLTSNLLIAEKIEDSSLPLFRVGVIWTQILLIIESIPLITIVYKLDLNFIFQALIVLLYFFISSLIYLHTLLLSKKGEEQVDSDHIKVVVIQMCYLPFIAAIATSFMPAESFLRATFITSVYMGIVGYSRSYLENSITKTLIIQYSLIIMFFLAVMFVFKPWYLSKKHKYYPNLKIIILSKSRGRSAKCVCHI